MPTTAPLSAPSPPARKWRADVRADFPLYLAYLAFGAMLIGILAMSHMQAKSGFEALEQLRRTAERTNHLDRLTRLLLEAQTEVRGYALTRDPGRLQAFREKGPAIRDTRRLIEADLMDEARLPVATLVARSQTVVDGLERLAARIEAGEAPRRAELDADTAAMRAYRRLHADTKALLAERNRDNVRRSTAEFDNARIGAMMLAAASLLLLTLAVAQTRKRRALKERMQTMLEAENERLEREVQVRTAELNNLATYLTAVREKEKLSLARELHDELGALLTAAKLDADWIERTLPPDARATVAQRMERLRQSLIGGITLKRRITNGLRPALLYDLGLIEALHALIEEFRQGEEIEIEADLPATDPALGEELSLSLFRIAQEALTNIRKYAHARHVGLSLRQTADAVELSIADDGLGFDPDCHKVARHGLAGIKHRVFTHGGRLDLRAAPGAGVTIRIVLPNRAARLSERASTAC